MTPASIQFDIVPQTARADFSARVQAHLRTLKQRLSQQETLIEVLRGANAESDPVKVAGWLVAWADECLPAPCWAVVAPGADGERVVLADKGVTPDLVSAVSAASERVTASGRGLAIADLSQDPGAGGARGTIIAFPLVSRGRAVGVLVGLDPMPSATVPSLGVSVSAAMQVALEPAAIALDNALTIARAEALSVTDDLTGLSNSRYLNAVLHREEKRSVRSGHPLSLLFIDLDGFKNVNTAHGHQAGSRTLVEVGAVIKSCARETDVVGRYGGDEFAVVLPDTGAAGALFVGHRICDRVRSSRYLTGEGLSIHLTASVGVSTLPDVSASAEELLRAADRAMYRVKNSGKNGLHVAERDN